LTYAFFQNSTTIPLWLTYLLLAGSLTGYIIGVLTFFDRRKRDIKTDSKSEASVELMGWSLDDRLALERRLTSIEREVSNQKELHDVLEKMMARVLHSPHRPDLDRLLEKIDDGKILTPQEVKLISDWLGDVASDPAVTKGEQTAASILLALVNAKYNKKLVAKGTC
jgi:hypothetical protein